MKRFTFLLITAFMAFGLSGNSQGRDTWTEDFESIHSNF